MKIAIISDIHANYQALSALATDLCAADQVICLGDFTGYYCEVNQVIAFLRDINAKCVLGNHDHFVLTDCPAEMPVPVQFGIEFAKKNLQKKHKRWMDGLPWVWGGMLDGKSMLFAHGSPWNPMEDYLYVDSLKLQQMRDFRFDLAAFGQTHRYFYGHSNNLGEPLLLNPGSVGQNRDLGQQAIASAVIIETQSMMVEHLQKPYDPDPVIASARRSGAGEWITRHLKS